MADCLNGKCVCKAGYKGNGKLCETDSITFYFVHVLLFSFITVFTILPCLMSFSISLNPLCGGSSVLFHLVFPILSICKWFSAEFDSCRVPQCK